MFCLDNTGRCNILQWNNNASAVPVQLPDPVAQRSVPTDARSALHRSILQWRILRLYRLQRWRTAVVSYPWSWRYVKASERAGESMFDFAFKHLLMHVHVHVHIHVHAHAHLHIHELHERENINALLMCAWRDIMTLTSLYITAVGRTSFVACWITWRWNYVMRWWEPMSPARPMVWSSRGTSSHLTARHARAPTVR